MEHSEDSHQQVKKVGLAVLVASYVIAISRILHLYGAGWQDASLF